MGKARARTEKSTTLDAVITLADTISSKLELVSYDYRGSDALKIELSLFHKLLQRTMFFQTNLQPSFLPDLFAELRHFCLILWKERGLVYVMVEEISRFRETLGIFRRQLCELNGTCLLDELLDTLQMLEDNESLGELKLELNLIRLMNQASPQLFPLCNIMAKVYDEATQFCYIVREMIERSSVNHELVIESCSSIRASMLKCCKHPILELQSETTCAWHFLQLNAFYDSLSASLWGIYFWGQCNPRTNHFIQHLMNTVTFLKSFMRLAGSEIANSISEWCLIHCQASAIEAASLGYRCWFYRDDADDQLQLRSCELAEKVIPGRGNIQVTQKYIQTLSNSADAYLHSQLDWLSALDFVGYLHDYVYRLVNDHNTCLEVSRDQIKGIALTLSHIRKNLWTNCFSWGLFIKMTVIILDLHTLKRKDKMPKELDLLTSDTSYTWIPEFVKKANVRAMAKRELEYYLPRLIVNGVVVNSSVKMPEQIKYQLLNGSTGLDLIAIVPKIRVSFATNLANMVYCDSDVIHHFKIRAQCLCTAAQGYEQNRKTLLKEVLDCISSRDYSEMSEDDLSQAVKERLQGKRYLVVLNDVRRSQQTWRDMLSSFPNDENQSKILLTSEVIVSDPRYFSLEPISSIRRGMVKMGSCCKGR